MGHSLYRTHLQKLHDIYIFSSFPVVSPNRWCYTDILSKKNSTFSDVSTNSCKIIIVSDIQMVLGSWWQSNNSNAVLDKQVRSNLASVQ